MFAPCAEGMTRADGAHEARCRPESVAVATPKTRSLSPLGHPHVGDCVGDQAEVSAAARVGIVVASEVALVTPPQPLE